jgi:hypothetical protein
MEVKHNEDQQKFYLLKDGKESYALYRMHNKETMNIFRVYVPPEQRHQGLAAKVARAALEFAKENNLKVIPSCSYTDYFIEQNKEYEELLKSPFP